MVEEIINSVDTATWQEDRWLQGNIELCKKIDENKSEKEAEEGPSFFLKKLAHFAS